MIYFPTFKIRIRYTGFYNDSNTIQNYLWEIRKILLIKNSDKKIWLVSIFVMPNKV